MATKSQSLAPQGMSGNRVIKRWSSRLVAGSRGLTSSQLQPERRQDHSRAPPWVELRSRWGSRCQTSTLRWGPFTTIGSTRYSPRFRRAPSRSFVNSSGWESAKAERPIREHPYRIPGTARCARVPRAGCPPSEAPAAPPAGSASPADRAGTGGRPPFRSAPARSGSPRRSE